MRVPFVHSSTKEHRWLATIVLAVLVLFLATNPVRPVLDGVMEFQFTADTFQALYAPFGLCNTQTEVAVSLRLLPLAGDRAFVEGLALAASGQYAAAVGSLELAYGHRPRPTTALMIGNLYHYLGDSTTALHWWQLGKAVDMFLTRAHLCALAGASSEDKAYLEAAAQILPPTYENWRSYKPLRRIAQIRFIQGRYDEAIALYQEIIEHVPPESQNPYRLSLAQTCQQAGDRLCAVEQYRLLLASDPDNKEALEALSALGEMP